MNIEIIHEFDSTQKENPYENLERFVLVKFENNLSIYIEIKVEYNQQHVKIEAITSLRSEPAILEEIPFYENKLYLGGHTIDFDVMLDTLQVISIRKGLRAFITRGYKLEKYLTELGENK